MPAGLAGYVPLLGLVSPWAKQGSVPSAMVLRRICDWGLTDVFPVGAFVTKTGDKVDPFDLYVSCRALEAGDRDPMDLGTQERAVRGRECLEDVYVSIQDMLA